MGMPFHVKQNIKSAQLVLESLKRDHEQALSALKLFCSSQTRNLKEVSLPTDTEKVFNAEKIPLIKDALNRIEKGLDDSEVMITFSKYVEHLEAENLKIQLHNQRLSEETTWLRDELKSTLARLETNESLLAQVQVEKQHLEFMLELRKYDTSNDISYGGHGSDYICNTLPVEYSKTTVPSMVASVMGLTSTPSHMSSSQQLTISPTKKGFHRPSVPVFSSLSLSDHLEMSNIMNNSLIDTDLESLHTSRPQIINYKSNSTQLLPVPPRLQTLHRIIIQYIGQGKHEVAASLCLQAIKDLKDNEDVGQTEITVLLNMLALVYRDQGKYQEASDVLKEIVLIREKTLGPNHLLVAAALNNLAVLYAKVGRFVDAEPLCRRALLIRENVLGADHLDVAKQLNNLALLCQSQGKFDEVELAFKRSLSIYLKHYRATSPIIRKAKNNLASAFLKCHNLTEAESLLKSVLTPNSYIENFQQSCNYLPSSSTLGSKSIEHDSAVYSLSSIESFRAEDQSFTHKLSNEQGEHKQTPCVFPLWLIVERYLHDNRMEQLLHPDYFSIADWASKAEIELPVVQTATRNLAIVYQRQGHHEQANILLNWLQSFTKNKQFK